MNISDFDFTEVSGNNCGHDVVLFALSTCGFCKRAMEFLNENSIAYRYLHADMMSAEKRSILKEEYKKQYGNRLLYPTAIIDGKKILNGFIRPSWENALTLSAEQ